MSKPFSSTNTNINDSDIIALILYLNEEFRDNKIFHTILRGATPTTVSSLISDRLSFFGSEVFNNKIRQHPKEKHKPDWLPAGFPDSKIPKKSSEYNWSWGGIELKTSCNWSISAHHQNFKNILFFHWEMENGFPQITECRFYENPVFGEVMFDPNTEATNVCVMEATDDYHLVFTTRKQSRRKKSK